MKSFSIFPFSAFLGPRRRMWLPSIDFSAPNYGCSMCGLFRSVPNPDIWNMPAEPEPEQLPGSLQRIRRFLRFESFLESFSSIGAKLCNFFPPLGDFSMRAHSRLLGRAKRKQRRAPTKHAYRNLLFLHISVGLIPKQCSLHMLPNKIGRQRILFQPNRAKLLPNNGPRKKALFSGFSTFSPFSTIFPTKKISVHFPFYTAHNP